MHFFIIPFELIYATARTIFINFLVFKRYADCLAVELYLRLDTVLKKFIEFREVVADVLYDFVEFFNAIGLHFSEQFLHVRFVFHGFSVEAVEEMGFVLLKKYCFVLWVFKGSGREYLLCRLRSTCAWRLLLWEWKWKVWRPILTGPVLQWTSERLVLKN